MVRDGRRRFAPRIARTGGVFESAASGRSRRRRNAARRVVSRRGMPRGGGGSHVEGGQVDRRRSAGAARRASPAAGRALRGTASGGMRTRPRGSGRSSSSVGAAPRCAGRCQRGRWGLAVGGHCRFGRHVGGDWTLDFSGRLFPSREGFFDATRPEFRTARSCEKYDVRRPNPANELCRDRRRLLVKERE